MRRRLTERTLCAIVFAAAAGVPTATTQEDTAQREGPCDWSEEWQQLRQRFPRVPEDAEITGSKRTKGEITRPTSRVRRTIRGFWKVAVVVDEEGKVRDARVTVSPEIEPPWPEYEEAIVKSIRRWRYRPVKVNGTPWPNCTTVTVREQ